MKHHTNSSNKAAYAAPTCTTIHVAPERLIAYSGQALEKGGNDTQASTTNGKTWGEVKGNTVDWDEE